MFNVVVPVVVTAACVLGLAASQQPIRSGARTVAVFATVTDSTGSIQTDLTKDDFEIDDNGRRQDITVVHRHAQGSS